MKIQAFQLILLFTRVESILSQAACNDSTLIFKLNEQDRTCESDVVGDPLLCSAGGDVSGNVTTHCPSACGLANCTGIESDMRFSVLLEKPFGSGNWVSKWKTCSWVALNSALTCSRCDKEGVQETCPISCAACVPTPSPTSVPTPAPTSAPTVTLGTPAPTLSDAPSVSPSTTNTCLADSPLRFRFKRKIYNCDIIRKRNPDLCGESGTIPGDVSRHCPYSCGERDCVGKQSNVYFQVVLKKNGKPRRVFKKCSWVNANNNAHCTKRCSKNGITATCPVSCSQC